MRVPFLDLARESRELRPELETALAATFGESRFVLGDAVAEFERAWAAFCGAAHAVGVASGTDALAIALRAVGVGPGDEVVTAANTCVPTAAGIEAAGATPVLADVDPVTLTLDPVSAAAAIGRRTRALVPVHLYGRCAAMRPLLALASEHGLAVVEDAAQAHGAELEGRRAGTLGDAAAFSFYPTKNLGAAGDAGAVVTSDPEVADRARLLRAYGAGEDGLSLVRGANSRLDTVQAAVLLVKLPRLERWNARRRALADRYAEGLADVPIGLPPRGLARSDVHHLHVVRVADRDAFRAALLRAGVETHVHYPRPVHRHPAYAALARPGALDASEQAAGEVVSLPLYPQLADAEADAVIEAVAAAGGGR